MNHTLHHSTATVVLDEAFPSRLRHVPFLVEPLLLKELDGKVVCVGQEILESSGLSMSFQSVHQSCTHSFDLFRSCDCKENNFSESLVVKRPEHTASNDHRLLVWLVFHDDHGFVLTVHNQLDDVGSWHLWQLLSNNVLKVN